jgi:hypothetical protein
MRKVYTPTTAAVGVEEVLRLLEGRWKLIILFHLFDGKVQRYSDFEKLIPGISQKMLAQQLRQLEADGIVARKVYPQVPQGGIPPHRVGTVPVPRAGCATRVGGAEGPRANPAQQGAAPAIGITRRTAHLAPTHDSRCRALSLRHQ